MEVVEAVERVGVAWPLLVQTLVEALHPPGAVVDKEDVVADVELVVPQGHLAVGVAALDLLHELVQLVAVLPHLPAKVFGHVDVAAPQEPGLPQDLLLVPVVDDADLDGFVAPEVRPVGYPLHPVHRNVPRDVELFDQNVLHLQNPDHSTFNSNINAKCQ